MILQSISQQKKKVKLIVKSIFLVAASVASAVIFPKLAYAERGYKAVGGEWILILSMFGFAGYVVYNGVKTYIVETAEENGKVKRSVRNTCR